jgi:hypothetical protein
MWHGGLLAQQTQSEAPKRPAKQAFFIKENRGAGFPLKWKRRPAPDHDGPIELINRYAAFNVCVLAALL